VSFVQLRVRALVSTVATVAALASIALVGASGAAAATVVNGDFESGTLSGWQLQNEPSGLAESGSWFAYSGTVSPLEPGIGPPVPPPPAGNFAAITDQEGPGTHILYQDIAVEPGNAQRLSMLLYYASDALLATPEPHTLSFEEFPNQQYRVDLVRPTAPLETVDPADILATIFATKTGDPESRSPFLSTIELAPFAGQTVRLRLVEVDNGGFLWAGADSISILNPPAPPAPAPTPPSNAIAVGKLERNLKKGTAKLTVTVPGAGVLQVTDARFGAGTAKKRLLKSATLQASGGGTVKVSLKPTAAGRKVLGQKDRLRVGVALSFTPTGGTAGSLVVKKVLKQTPKKP
jgi:hypothetical protein